MLDDLCVEYDREFTLVNKSKKNLFVYVAYMKKYIGSLTECIFQSF